MRKLLFLAAAIVLVVILVQVSTSESTGNATAASEADIEARKVKILENLKLKYEQLREAGITMKTLEPSPYSGLDEGIFVVGGRQEQKFLITHDDTKMYLIGNDVLDVSKSVEEVKAEFARLEEEKRQELANRAKEIETMIAGLPYRGNPDAPVTIIEYSDFQCPYCARGADTVEQILEKYPNDVKFVFQHFPLGFHPWAKPAAIASHCAGLQDNEAFWTLHDAYFKDQKNLDTKNVLPKSREYLAGSGIDMTAWANCAEDTSSEAYKAASKVVDDQMAAGQKMGVSGTPGFFVNGQFLNGAQPLTAFEPLIEQAKASAQ